MKRLYSVTVKGEPVAQARARSTILTTKGTGTCKCCHQKVGAKQWINHYTPVKSSSYRKLVQDTIRKQGLPSVIFDEPLIMEVRFYSQKPKSVKRVWKTTKPDLDNYIKAVKDAMNGLVYRDDSTIIGYLNTWKLYTDKEPYTIISLYTPQYLETIQ